MPKLILYFGSTDQSELDLNGRDAIVLGRSDGSDVVIRRRMASRAHAVIERRDGRFHVRDTESYNGTFVNNRPIREAQLVHGDEIRVAGSVFRYVDFVSPTPIEPGPQGDTLILQREDELLLEVAHGDLPDAEPEERTPTAPSRPPAAVIASDTTTNPDPGPANDDSIATVSIGERTTQPEQRPLPAPESSSPPDPTPPSPTPGLQGKEPATGSRAALTLGRVASPVEPRDETLAAVVRAPAHQEAVQVTADPASRGRLRGWLLVLLGLLFVLLVGGALAVFYRQAIASWLVAR